MCTHYDAHYAVFYIFVLLPLSVHVLYSVPVSHIPTTYVLSNIRQYI
jgi:RsiW-degrading membrane proteinase PrsW (M82 family)